MKNEVKSITRYFKSALITRNQSSINLTNQKLANYIIIDKENFCDGKLQDDSIKELISRNEKEQIIKNWKKKDYQENIDIIIIAKTIKTLFSNTIKDNGRNKTEELTGILYIPAALDYKGNLSKNNKWPWIPREFLEPMIDPTLSLGKVSEINKFFENTTGKRNQIRNCNWGEYINYIEELYSQTIKPSIIKNSIALEDDIYIVLDTAVNAAKEIVDCYEDIEQIENFSETSQLRLYKNFMTPSIEKSKDLIPNSCYKKMKSHYGQMSGEYPLADSQREALNHFSELKEGELLAISGPPGTGKTTLLQSIVANMLVKNAIEQKDAPIIVASSVNNQAATNIIDSFGSVKTIGIKNLDQRWIQGVESFALYFPSSSKIKEAEEKGYQYVNKIEEDEELLGNITSSKNIKESAQKMIENVNSYFNVDYKNIEQCSSIIHKKITNIDNLKKEIIVQLNEMQKVIGSESSIDSLCETNNKKISILVNEQENLKKQQEANNDKINNYQKRADEWNMHYKKVPHHIKLLGIFDGFKQKSMDILKIYMKSDEYMFLKDCTSFSEIITQYGKQIEKLHQNNIELTKEIDSKNRAIDEINYMTKMLAKEKDKVKDKLQELIKEIYMVEENLSSESIQQYSGQYSLVDINKYLDKSVRYAEFWLAVHYYECKWLREMMHLEEIKDSKNKMNAREKLKSLYHRFAMITPCMVMTFYSLPKKLKVDSKDEKQKDYLYDFIDLLIVDEAGQASPEIGAASFAFAKKAIVVGDEYQIDPIWGTISSLDKALALENLNKQPNDVFYEDVLIKCGLNCSQSSVMKVACNSCAYEKYGQKGLFLSEHRRCYDEIIQFCNDLVYEGKLLPCRGSGKDDHNYPLKNYPRMGYKNIDVRKAERSGNSKINREEAEEIVKWLEEHYEEIASFYYKDIEKSDLTNILAIITPFRPQTNILKSMLKKRLTKYAKYIDVGTVHAFQGAERKIIILSTVYGKEDGCHFIDNSKSLMNVAVSRAKDAFWIFGTRECLSKNETVASGKLRKYTCEEIQ